ncbi:MAG: carboxypeptidase-like regulatory domain-containing protein [Bacteroidota bacterium]
MDIKFVIIFICVSTLSFNSSVAQRVIEGKVLDASNNEPLVGASILEKDTSNGTVSDVNGNFDLILGENSVIIVSYSGYNTQELNVGNERFVEVKLFRVGNPTNDVVVSGRSDKQVKDYFPMRSAIGFEIIRTIDPSPREEDRFEYGINYLFTAWDESNRNLNVIREDRKFLEDFRVYQIGPSFLFSPIPRDQDRQAWQMRTGIIYNRFSFETIGLGFTARLNAVTVLNDNRQIADDLNAEAALGITFFGVVNLYYGRLLTLDDFTNLPENTITVSVNLNASAFKYGLQGI